MAPLSALAPLLLGGLAPFSLRNALFFPQAKTTRHAVFCPLILSSEHMTCLFFTFPPETPFFSLRV